MTTILPLQKNCRLPPAFCTYMKNIYQKIMEFFFSQESMDSYHNELRGRDLMKILRKAIVTNE